MIAAPPFNDEDQAHLLHSESRTCRTGTKMFTPPASSVDLAEFDVQPSPSVEVEGFVDSEVQPAAQVFLLIKADEEVSSSILPEAQQSSLRQNPINYAPLNSSSFPPLTSSLLDAHARARFSSENISVELSEKGIELSPDELRLVTAHFLSHWSSSDSVLSFWSLLREGHITSNSFEAYVHLDALYRNGPVRSIGSRIGSSSLPSIPEGIEARPVPAINSEVIPPRTINSNLPSDTSTVPRNRLLVPIRIESRSLALRPTPAPVILNSDGDPQEQDFFLPEASSYLLSAPPSVSSSVSPSPPAIAPNDFDQTTFPPVVSIHDYNINPLAPTNIRTSAESDGTISPGTMYHVTPGYVLTN